MDRNNEKVMNMEKCMIRLLNWHKKGSYTVEASLLMVIIITLLTAVIYLGFFLHDRAYLQNAAYETALVACLNLKEDNLPAKVEDKKKEFLNGRLLGSKNVEGSAAISNHKITVYFQGEFPVPGLVMWYFCRNKLPIQAKISLSIKDPKSTVNKIHGIESLKKQVYKRGKE